jgi:hypothetical protein
MCASKTWPPGMVTAAGSQSFLERLMQPPVRDLGDVAVSALAVALASWRQGT